MTAFDVVAIATAVGLFAYLTFALLFPERFA